MAKVTFTAGRVNGFKCPPDKAQAFLWDATQPGLGLRATPNGKPSYVFQSVYGGKDIRLTIGHPSAWSIPDAQAKARELQRQIDEGHDPRDLKRQRMADKAAADAADIANAVTVGQAWNEYVEDRRPYWGDRHYQDHIAKAQQGGQPAKRGTRGRKVTVDGPLFPLMALPLRDLTAERVTQWAAAEAKTRPTVARLAWRLLRAFLSWCAEQEAYKSLMVAGNPAKTNRTRQSLGKPGAKRDSLQREQLKTWFAAVRQIRNQSASTYLQTVLLTGARPGEVLEMKWSDLDFQWSSLVVRDKVEGERTIPLTPYVAHILSGLPRRNEWVFSSTTVLSMEEKNVKRRARSGSAAPSVEVIKRSESGHIAEPSRAHKSACKVAGLEPITLHGLRRSFGTLAEWVEMPAGISAQIQGHKPSATREKHYIVRPLDLLRVWSVKIEAWILEQAGIDMPSAPANRNLRAVAV